MILSGPVNHNASQLCRTMREASAKKQAVYLVRGTEIKQVISACLKTSRRYIRRPEVRVMGLTSAWIPLKPTDLLLVCDSLPTMEEVTAWAQRRAFRSARKLLVGKCRVPTTMEETCQAIETVLIVARGVRLATDYFETLRCRHGYWPSEVAEH